MMRVIIRVFLVCTLIISMAGPALSTMEKADCSVLHEAVLKSLVGGNTEGTIGVKIVYPTGYSALNNNETTSSRSYVVDINNIGANNAANYNISVNGEVIRSGSVTADTTSLITGSIPVELHQSGEHAMVVDAWRANDEAFHSRSTVQYVVP